MQKYDKNANSEIFSNLARALKFYIQVPQAPRERLPHVLQLPSEIFIVLVWYILVAVPRVLCDLPVSPHFLALFYAN